MARLGGHLCVVPAKTLVEVLRMIPACAGRVEGCVWMSCLPVRGNRPPIVHRAARTEGRGFSSPTPHGMPPAKDGGQALCDVYTPNGVFLAGSMNVQTGDLVITILKNSSTVGLYLELVRQIGFYT